MIYNDTQNRLESFEVVNDGRVLIGKPFVISNKLFYVATERRRDATNTSADLLVRSRRNKPKSSTSHILQQVFLFYQVTHVTGSCMMVLFHNSLPHILQTIENMTSSALHNSTFSDSMGGDVFSMDDVLGALFETDEVKDDMLVFEV